MHGQAESGLFDLGHELGLCACELQSCDVANYSFQRASSRSVRWIALWLVRLVGLASGFVLIGPSGAAQAQVQMQTAIGGGTYQMPLGMVMSEDMLMSEQDVSPRTIHRRVPIGDDALGQIKTNQPVAPAQRQGPFTSAPQPPPSESPTVPPSCQTNSAVGFLPSDIHGAAGPANIVTVTNVEVGVYNKTNCALVSKVSLKTFFNAFSIPATQTLFDPRVLYDPAVDRFFVSADSDDSTNADQFQYFAVSTDNTGTTWFQYRFFLSQGGSFFCKQAANSLWDYPSAGYSSARWFITANDFGITTVRGAIISIDKAPSLVGTAPSAICFNDLVFNIAPPLVQDSSTTPYFLSPGSGSGNSITRYQLTEGASVGSDTLSTTSPITVTAWTAAPDAASRRSPNDLPAGPRRPNLWRPHGCRMLTGRTPTAKPIASLSPGWRRRPRRRAAEADSRGPGLRRSGPPPRRAEAPPAGPVPRGPRAHAGHARRRRRVDRHAATGA